MDDYDEAGDADAGDTDTAESGTVNQSAAGSMAVSAKTIKVKYSKLRKKAQKRNAITVSGNKGTVTYKLVSAKKAVKKNGRTVYQKGYRKYIKVNASTGKVTIKKGLKKGTYKVKVNVTDAGDAGTGGTTQTVTFKLRVR